MTLIETLYATTKRAKETNELIVDTQNRIVELNEELVNIAANEKSEKQRRYRNKIVKGQLQQAETTLKLSTLSLKKYEDKIKELAKKI